MVEIENAVSSREKILETGPWTKTSLVCIVNSIEPIEIEDPRTVKFPYVSVLQAYTVYHMINLKEPSSFYLQYAHYFVSYDC